MGIVKNGQLDGKQNKTAPLSYVTQKPTQNGLNT